MGKKKVVAKEVFRNELGAVETRTARTWFRGIFIQIPPLPPSGLSNCNIIDISYKLKVKILVEKPSIIYTKFKISGNCKARTTSSENFCLIALDCGHHSIPVPLSYYVWCCAGSPSCRLQQANAFSA